MASSKKMHLAKKMKATKDKEASSTSTKGLTGSSGSKDEGSAKVAVEDAGAGSSKQAALANKIKSCKQPIVVKTIKVSKDTSVSKSPAPPSSMEPLVKKLTSSKKSAQKIVLPGCSAGTMDSISPIEPFLVKKIKKSSSPKEAEGSAAVSKKISMTKAPVLVMSSLENDLTKEKRFDHLEDLTAVKKASLTHDGEERGLSKKASSEQRVLGKKSSTKKTRKHASEMNTSFKGESVSVEATNSKDHMDSPSAKNVGLEVEHIFVTASLPTEEEHTLTNTASMQEKQTWKKSLSKSASSLTNTAKIQEEFELVVKPSLTDESFFKKSTRKQKEKRMDKEASFTMGSGVSNETSLAVNSGLAKKSSLKKVTSLTKKVSHSESIGSPKANSLPDLKKSPVNSKFPSKLKVAELDEAETQKEPEEMVGSSSLPPEDMSDEGKYKAWLNKLRNNSDVIMDISGSYKMVRIENAAGYMLANGARTPGHAMHMAKFKIVKNREIIKKTGPDSYTIKKLAEGLPGLRGKLLEFKLGETFNEPLNYDGVQYQSTFTMEGENKLKQIQKCLTWDEHPLTIWREYADNGMKMTTEVPNSAAQMVMHFKKLR